MRAHIKMLRNCYRNAKIYKSHDLAVREENLTSKKMKKRDVNYDDLKSPKWHQRN